MSFRYLVCLSFLISSCGVKGPPKAPANTSVPSFTNSYLNTSDKKTSFEISPSEQEENEKEKEK